MIDAALDAVLMKKRERYPLTAFSAAMYAELAYRDGRTDDALRLIDIAHEMAEQRFGIVGSE